VVIDGTEGKIEALLLEDALDLAVAQMVISHGVRSLISHGVRSFIISFYRYHDSG